MPKISRKLIIWLVILVGVVVIFFTFISPGGGGGGESLDMSDLIAELHRPAYEEAEVIIIGTSLTAVIDGEAYKATVGENFDAFEEFKTETDYGKVTLNYGERLDTSQLIAKLHPQDNEYAYTEADVTIIGTSLTAVIDGEAFQATIPETFDASEEFKTEIQVGKVTVNDGERLDTSELIGKLHRRAYDEAEVTIKGSSLTAVIDGKTYKTTIGENFDTRWEFRTEIDQGALKLAHKPSGGFNWGGILINFLPLILFGALLIFILRQAQGGSSQAMSFGKSRARLASGDKPTISFGDVAGVEEAKQELEEVVEFLRYPEKFLSLGARIPRGVLLIGPPGTGKTLLARAVAGEAGVPFFSISGSEFVEMFVGVGASRVRDLFDQAKRNAPCIIFVDEIDAVGRHRGSGLGGGHDEREQTLNQILVEMDGFDSSTKVIVLSATNRPDILDPALLRPGRFDRRVILDQPDIIGRKAILEVHAKGKPLDPTADLEIIAKQTPFFSGADLANLVNEAALLAARRNKKAISLDELQEAIERVQLGPERKSRVVSQKEKEVIAHHEAGHALVARMLPHADPVYKISIVARGMAGGYTKQLPTEDRHLYSIAQLHDMMTTYLGGRAAEEIMFGSAEVTTGASSDLEQISTMARKMVKEYGMSEKLGLRTFGRREELVFLGRMVDEQKDYGDKVADEIDDEIRRLIDSAFTEAKDILTKNKAKLIQIAERLIVEETLEGEALQAVFNEPVPSSPDAAPAS